MTTDAATLATREFCTLYARQLDAWAAGDDDAAVWAQSYVDVVWGEFEARLEGCLIELEKRFPEARKARVGVARTPVSTVPEPAAARRIGATTQSEVVTVRMTPGKREPVVAGVTDSRQGRLF